VFKDPKQWLTKQTKPTESIHKRVQNIQERKRILEWEYQAEIEPKKLRRDMYEMLKKIEITPQLNKDGLLDDLQESYNEQKMSRVKINITA
jgi:hypothetical protein